eukprot:TRINITY_DN585_c0_g1_i1.p1 TRINITY_DN585_c0_g1~~TRINITY_DN585_c0_g1_i1.p1  ORF type:complete len:1257 (+),score=279.34 TRINITY_DN585_c0_g1_i1:548-3772(+)
MTLHACEAGRCYSHFLGLLANSLSNLDGSLIKSNDAMGMGVRTMKERLQEYERLHNEMLGNLLSWLGIPIASLYKRESEAFKEADSVYYKAVQTHETISLKYLKRDVKVEQLDTEFSQSKNELRKATSDFIKKINEINIGGKIDLLVGYYNALGSMENSWKTGITHSEFYSGFSKDFYDYSLKIRNVAREKWKGIDIFGDRVRKEVPKETETLAVPWRGRGAWPGRQPRRASVGRAEEKTEEEVSIDFAEKNSSPAHTRKVMSSSRQEESDTHSHSDLSRDSEEARFKKSIDEVTSDQPSSSIPSSWKTKLLNPDVQGWLFVIGKKKKGFSTSERCYFGLSGSVLTKFWVTNDGKLETQEWSLLLAALKTAFEVPNNGTHKQPNYFELVFCDPGRAQPEVLCLQATNKGELEIWKAALTNAISLALSSGKQTGQNTSCRIKLPSNAITKILEHNPVCVDCGKSGPEWASINLGVLFCIECSGVHRALGVNISKVRSLQLDNFDVESVELLTALGNSTTNQFLEASATPEDRKDRASFIQRKYVEKAFMIRYPQESLVSSLFLYVETGKLSHLFWILLLGADPNSVDEDGYTTLHVATKAQNYLVMRLLLNNSAAVDALGPNNETPLLMALKQKDLRALLVLLSAGVDRRPMLDPPNEEWKAVMDSLPSDMHRAIHTGLTDEEILAFLYADTLPVKEEEKEQMNAGSEQSKSGRELTRKGRIRSESDLGGKRRHLGSSRPSTTDTQPPPLSIPEENLSRRESLSDESERFKTPQQRTREATTALARKESSKHEEGKERLRRISSQLALRTTSQQTLGGHSGEVAVPTLLILEGKAGEKARERSVERSGERSGEKSGEKSEEKSDEKSGEKSTDKTPGEKEKTSNNGDAIESGGTDKPESSQEGDNTNADEQLRRRGSFLNSGDRTKKTMLRSKSAQARLPPAQDKPSLRGKEKETPIPQNLYARVSDDEVQAEMRKILSGLSNEFGNDLQHSSSRKGDKDSTSGEKKKSRPSRTPPACSPRTESEKSSKRVKSRAGSTTEITTRYRSNERKPVLVSPRAKSTTTSSTQTESNDQG